MDLEEFVEAVYAQTMHLKRLIIADCGDIFNPFGVHESPSEFCRYNFQFALFGGRNRRCTGLAEIRLPEGLGLDIGARDKLSRP